MTQHTSARRGGPRRLFLVLLALVALLALAYVVAQPSAPPAVAPTPIVRATADPPAAAPTLTAEPAIALAPAETPTATPEAAAAGLQAAPSRTPALRATLAATATRRIVAATATRKPPSAATPTRKPTRRPSATPTSNSPLPSAPLNGLPTIRYDRLPKEARTTIGLILQGGPFPYSQDGVVFQNRERILPRKASGYYHEYTVKTPGSPDRGPRRIVTGEDGEFYYTDDHYDSFRQVTP